AATAQAEPEMVVGLLEQPPPVDIRYSVAAVHLVDDGLIAAYARAYGARSARWGHKSIEPYPGIYGEIARRDLHGGGVPRFHVLAEAVQGKGLAHGSRRERCAVDERAIAVPEHVRGIALSAPPRDHIGRRVHALRCRRGNTLAAAVSVRQHPDL